MTYPDQRLLRIAELPYANPTLQTNQPKLSYRNKEIRRTVPVGQKYQLQLQSGLKLLLA